MRQRARRQPILPLALLSAVVLLVAACGSSSESVETSGTGNQGPAQVGDQATAWSTETLGGLSPDGGVAAAADGATAVVVAAGFDGFSAWYDDGGGFVPAEVDGPVGGEAQSVSAVAAVPGGFLAALNDHRNFEPVLWFSEDGSAWRSLATVGLDGPADVTSIGVSDESVVLGGAARGGSDPGSGPFSPVTWHSDDLMTWTAGRFVAGSDDVRDGAVTLVTATDTDGTDLLATGPSAEGTLFWRSEDGGLTWASVDRPGVGSQDRPADLTAVAGHDGRLVTVGIGESESGAGMVLASSDDGGSTWADGDLSAVGVSGLSGGFSVTHSGAGWWATASRFLGAWEDPEACYEDPEGCGGGEEPLLLFSADGLAWAVVDLSGLDLPTFVGFDRVLDRGDSVSVLGTGEALNVWTLPSTSAPALLEPPAERPPADIELVEWSDDLEPGVTYRFPLYIHCGMGYLANFNGSHWYLDSGPEATADTGVTQAEELGWPVVDETIFGFVTLVDAETIEYSIDGGEVVATYGSSDEEPPGCD